MHTAIYFLLFCLLGSIRCHDGLFSVKCDASTNMKEIERIGTKYNLEWLDNLHPGEMEFKTESDFERSTEIKKEFAKLGVKLQILAENIDEMIQQEHSEEQSIIQASLKRSGQPSIISHFPKHAEINRWLHSLKKNHPKLVKLVSLGKSYEKRDMLMAKLSIGNSKNKKILFMDGGIHAREWLSIGSVIYILNKMVDGYANKDAKVMKMLSIYDVYILPVMNPDGYELTKNPKFRLWRKNRQPVSDKCKGIDLNRNFDIDFGVSGVVMDPCSDFYPGEKAFTTPEANNFKSFVMKNLAHIQVYINFHAYSQMLFVPYGFTTKTPPDHKEAMRVASAMVKAIKQTSGKNYTYGSAAQMLYPSSGGIDDWAKSVGVNYTFCFEVRPEMTDKKYGFLMPPSFIKPTGEELYASVMAGLKAINQ